MQKRFPFDNGEMLLTTSVLKRPSGKNLSNTITLDGDANDWGVTPDKTVPLTPGERCHSLIRLRMRKSYDGVRHGTAAVQG